jgi:hypothetical protein
MAFSQVFLDLPDDQRLHIQPFHVLLHLSTQLLVSPFDTKEKRWNGEPSLFSELE